MLVTVFCAPRDRSESTFSLEVSPDLELRDFLALCELESGIPAGEIQITYAEQPLSDPTRALGNYGLKDGDVVVIRQAEVRRPPPQPSFPGLPRIDFSTIAVPGTSSGQRPGSSGQRPGASAQRPPNPPQTQQPAATPPAAAAPAPAPSPQGLDDPALLRDMLLANPHELSLLKERNPPLAEALLSGDLERFTKVLLEQQQDRARREQERIRLLTADPFDLEAQAKIEEDIRQHNIEENMTIAMEEAPESFGQVVMLYINCKVNGHPVKAFVDSGAQMTIMSQACAERCNIMRLVDRRWAGIAKGVGTQKIIGRVHLAQVQIEGDFLPCSFSILEDQPMDMLLGLDMLKRHQCSIDLKKSVLLIGTTGTETRFLPEAELPECARLAYGAEGREETRPEEIADRELAEALQRSVQESDTEDGKSTSQQSPPLCLSKPYNPPSLSSSSSSSSSSSVANTGRHRNLALDRSCSAPASMTQTRPQNSDPKSQNQSQLQPQLQSESLKLQTQEEVTQSSPSRAQGVTAVHSEVHPNHAHQGPTAPLPDRPEQVAQRPPPQPQATAQAQIHANTTAQEVTLGTVPGQENTTGTDLANPVDSGSQLSASAVEDLPSGQAPPESLMKIGSDAEVQVPALAQEREMSRPVDAKRTCLDLRDERGSEASEGRCVGGKQSRGLFPGTEMTFAGLAESDEGPSVLSEETMEAGPTPDNLQPRDAVQPAGDCIPSLAQALMELHELLVTNQLAHTRERSPMSAARSPQRGSSAEGVEREPEMKTDTTPNPDIALTSSTHTATIASTDAGNAKAGRGAPADGRASESSTASSRSQENSDTSGSADTREGSKPGATQHTDTSETSLVRETRRETASEPDEISQILEPPEGQQGGGVANGQASGTNTTETPQCPANPSSQSSQLTAPADNLDSTPNLLTSPSPTQTPGLTRSARERSPPPDPTPSTGRFPTEHVRRIEAAGFSTQEAMAALEQAQGSVELALLVLLARNITVPT